MIAVRAQGITKTFEKRKALSDVSFSLDAGSFLAVFGSNGAGKTTLLRILATLDKPTQGTLYIFGKDVAEDAQELRARIGFISHSPMLYRDLTAYENLVFYAQLYGLKNPEQCADEMLETVGLLHRRNDIVRGFSRGMTQRVALARALIHNPQLLFLDEPYSGLDSKSCSAIDELLQQAGSERTSIMVSHNHERAYQKATHVLVLDKGRCVGFEETNGVPFSAFAQQYRSYLG